MRRFLVLMSLALASFIRPANAANVRPNIVFMLADDLGWADVGFHGGNVPTPHLDRLAREGLELTQHYSAATCSPTRAALMSGRYWSRFGIKGPENRRAFNWDTITLPRALKTVGYETALTGKWHLGSKPEWGPNHFGFDHSYGSLAGGVGPYDHQYKKGQYAITWHRNEKLISEVGHVTDLIMREAVQWIGERTDRPFFLYVPFTAVHLPLKEPQAWLDRVPATITGDVPRQYAACIMHLDAAVGQIVAALAKVGKRDNTLLVFTSDNGATGDPNHLEPYLKDGYAEGRIPGNNLPWRGRKAQLYEGGIRTPAVVSWPARLAAGRRDGTMHIIDWMPTLTAVAGYSPPRDLKWDGINVWPVIAGEKPMPSDRLLYWTQGASRAVRHGDLKLTVHLPRNSTGAPLIELFDLARDPHETTDLAPSRAADVKAMQAKLELVARADGDAAVKE